MARQATFKNTTYLRIGADGQFYSGSSEPREGHVEYTSKQGNVSYRKTYSGSEFGKITQLGIEEKTFPTGKVKYLVIGVENEDAKDVIQLPLMTMSDGLTDVVKKFTALLPGIDFSRDLTFSSNKKKNDRGYVDRVLFVNYVNDGKMEEQGLKFSLKFGKEGDVPMFETKTALDGTIKYDFSEQDRYLYGKLLEQLERFQKEKPSVASAAPVETPAPAATTDAKSNAPAAAPAASEGPNVVEDEDDLPF